HRREELQRARHRRAARASPCVRAVVARPRRAGAPRSREEGRRALERGARGDARDVGGAARRAVAIASDRDGASRDRERALGCGGRDAYGGGECGETDWPSSRAAARERDRMTMRLDIVTNDAGELVRREHARELGAGVVVSIYRLAKLAMMHDLGNQAFLRQLEGTTQTIHDYCLRSGGNVNILFAQKAIFVAG